MASYRAQQLPLWRRAAVAAALVLTGCSRIDLYVNLSEQQANEVAAVLLAAEIDADKRISETKAWAVRIEKADLPRAMDVLEASGYPKHSTASLVEVFKKDGFISSPLEERARFNGAVASELQQTIANMNGVIEARVHIAMPERNPLTDTVSPSSAAVFVKYGQDVNFTENGSLANVKALVRDSVEGLSVDRITVVATPSTGSWRYAVRPSPTQLQGYAYQKPLISSTAWLLLGIAAAVSLASAVGWWQRERLMRRWRRPAAAAKQNGKRPVASDPGT
jgi:type III secretion protein J